MEARIKNGLNIFLKAILILIILVLIVMIVWIATYIYQILNIDTYYEGVEVDGVPLGGMTIEEAKEAVWAENQPSLDRMKITLTHDGDRWEYGYKDIKAEINVDEIVEEAYETGREGTIIQRLKEIYAVSEDAKGYFTTLTYDVSQLTNKVRAIALKINEEPEDATIEFHPDKEEKFSFTPDKVGKGMLTDKTMEDLIKRVDADNFSAYEIPIEELPPQCTLDEVKTWTTRIGYYSTPLNNNSNRNYNIAKATKSFQGLRVEPGEVFSLNDAVGNPGAAEGYKLAPVIKKNQLEDGPGGGVCQTSTTLYGGILRADLEPVERYNHAMPSTYTPIGTDATISYPYTDFKFKNNKDTPVFITGYVSKGKLHVEVYGKASDEYDKIEIISWETKKTEVPEYKTQDDPTLYEGEEVIEYSSHAGIQAVAYKVYYKDGKEIKREKIANSSYRKIVGLKRVGTKKKAQEETGDKPAGDKPKDSKPKDDKPKDDKPKDDKPKDDKPKNDKPSGEEA